MVVPLTVVLTLVVVLNVALTFVLLRRVAGFDARLAALEKGAPSMADIGERVGEFSATTTLGEPLDRDDLTTGTLVGFFDPDCEVCQSHVTGFRAAAEALGDRSRTLVVVREREPEEVRLMVAAFGPEVRTVTEPRRGPVARAFHVMATPAFCTIGPDQVIAAHDYDRPSLAGAARP
ncbi:peroxiredoxin family protein [Virgisporangium ochraceum]|uniref:Alkyl hydroperoxide reductase subunit C/ Thiol specific antioxidant domain-containing protein n=1 Tax=Virgisporangium ochraceum TaxID=65505 RepID=A0A8J4EDD3_9ACTN|nr:redoxin domain-containing protein [Virgisporangium ochraceum]GIJ70584.1 hypothetical protein Voc01_055010 [Virgisporangium ochraceum]